jgi:hypothetical protein
VRVREGRIELDRAPVALGRLVPGLALAVELAAAHEPLARRVERLLAVRRDASVSTGAAPRRRRSRARADRRAPSTRRRGGAAGAAHRPTRAARERIALRAALAQHVGAAADPRSGTPRSSRPTIERTDTRSRKSNAGCSAISGVEEIKEVRSQ